jgi:glycosyltransferase involved in cell wall biosynthesis
MQVCKRNADAVVLWTSISPAPLGHLRDVLTVKPAFRPGQRVYAVVHRGDFDTLFGGRLLRTSSSRLVDRLTAVVFLNRQLADACRPWIPDPKRIVIPNTIDDAVLCSQAEIEARRVSFSESRPRRLLFLSNMIPSKGYREVLEAAVRLRDRGLSFRAEFAGGWTTPQDELEFERFVSRHGLREQVRHHGSIDDRSRIKSLHLSADVFLLPTYYPTEAQPLAILEAMNAGTPIVTTRHGSLPELVKDGDEGSLVPVQNAVALADAIESVLSPEAWLRHSRAAQERFSRQFSPEAVRSQWEALVES